MATPLGHALAGAAVGRLAAGQDATLRWRLSLWGALFAVAPDLDFLPGLAVGDPARFHQGISHSVGAALGCAFVAAVALAAAGRAAFRPLCIALSAGWLSHLAIDYFGADRSLPKGFPALWPLTEARFLAARPLLPGVRHSEGGESDLWSWIAALWVRDNVVAVALELLLFGGALWLACRRWPAKTAEKGV